MSWGNREAIRGLPCSTLKSVDVQCLDHDSHKFQLYSAAFFLLARKCARTALLKVELLAVTSYKEGRNGTELGTFGIF